MPDVAKWVCRKVTQPNCVFKYLSGMAQPLLNRRRSKSAALHRSAVGFSIGMGERNQGLRGEQLAKFFAWVDTFGPVCVQINL